MTMNDFNSMNPLYE